MARIVVVVQKVINGHITSLRVAHVFGLLVNVVDDVEGVVLVFDRVVCFDHALRFFQAEHINWHLTELVLEIRHYVSTSTHVVNQLFCVDDSAQVSDVRAVSHRVSEQLEVDKVCMLVIEKVLNVILDGKLLASS